MTATYFKPADPAHLALLPDKLRTATGLADVATEAERMAIDAFTAPAPEVLYTARLIRNRQATVVATVDGTDILVYLRGYAVDADAADPNLRLALRRAIANVIRWRLAQNRVDPIVASESSADGSKTVTYRNDAQDGLPEGWDDPLGPYDTREPPWGF